MIAELTELRGRIIISLIAGTVLVQPSPLTVSDDCQGWLHLERSASSSSFSWVTVDYYYGTWDNFELKDTQPVPGASIYRVAFFAEP